MKRLIAAIICAFLLTATFTGCSGINREQSEKINIICTTFPQYDWTRNIIGEKNMENFELTLLLNSRVDLHSYSPSVQDIAKIKTCDVFIFVGGGSDGWAEGVLKDSNPKMATMNLVEILGDRVIYDGHGHDEEDCDEDHDHDEPQADEHIWLSLKNAEIICAAITDMISEIDPENAAAYKNNNNAYAAKLSELDAEYRAAVNASSVTALVFADRFPFRYMMDDYGLDYYAAFHGCSAETEASFVTIISLATRLDQLGLDTVLVTESSDKSIAKTVIRESNNINRRILVLDAVQSLTSGDIRNGATYLSIMESNLKVLKEALE